MTIKLCTKCKINKESPKDFYRSKDYERTICRECFKQITLKQSKERKEAQKQLNPEFSYSREYYAKNKEKFVEYRKRFLEKHPGYMKRYQRKKSSDK